MEKITVLMPIRNGLRFLSNSIADIQSNIRDQDEVLVINDGSTDDTPRVLNTWSQENSQVRIISTKQLGLVSALNLGLRESTNDWVARFDVDDRYPSSRLDVQRHKIENATSAIFCDYEFFHENGKSLGVIPTAINENETALSLVSSQRTPHPGVLYNRRAVWAAEGYKASDFPAEDISLWLRMAKVGKLASVPQNLLYYRLGKNSVSSTQRAKALALKEDLIRSIGIQNSSIDYFAENWEYIFQEYSQQPFGIERKVLLVKEMKKINKIIGVSKKVEIEISRAALALVREPSLTKTICQLAYGKCKRHLARIT